MSLEMGGGIFDPSMFGKQPKKERTGGAKAQSQGKQAQKFVNAMNEDYESQGRAYVREVSVGFQVESFGTQGKATGRVKKGPVDYMGFWGEGHARGTGIAFDCKSSDAVSFPLKNIERHQMVFLNKATLQGCIGFFLIRMAKYDRWFVVLYEDIRDVWKATDMGGVKSLSIAWLIQHGRPVPMIHNRPDYLRVLPVASEREARRGR